MIINPYVYAAVAPPVSCTDTDGEAFITAAGITDNTQKSAVCQLVKDLKSANIWTKMKAIYPVLGGSASSHAVNLKTPGTYNLSFSTGWTHASTGMTPTNAYADTFINALSNLTGSSNHLSFYSRTTTVGTECEIGAADTTNQYYLQLRSAVNFASGGTSSIVSYTTTADGKGFWIGSKRANNDREGYRNSSSEATVTTNDTTSLPNYKLLIGARNNPTTSPAIALYSTKECAFASIGDGLTDTENSLLYQITEKYQVALGRNINTTQNFYYNGSYDNDTNVYLFRTQITDNTQQTAVNTLVTDMKSANIWSKMKALYPVLGGTAATHSINLAGNTTYNLSFATGMTHSSTGMTGNGSSGYANSNLNGNTVLGATSNHLSFYSGSQVTASQYEMGAINVNQYSMALNESVTTKKNIILGSYPSNWANVTDTNTKGFQIGSKTSATSLKLYWNNSNVATNTASYSSALPSANIYICALNYSTLYYSTKECRFASIGDGLTDTESSLLYQITEKYQVALGRNVNTTQSFYYNGAYDNDTNVYLFNTQITNTTQQTAVNTLVTDLKTYNIWTKMKAVYPVLGGTAATHAVNLTGNTAYNLSFSIGWTHSSNGMLPSAAYANTFLIPNSHLTNNSTHLSLYSRSNTDIASASFDIGTTNNVSAFLDLSLRLNNNLYADAYNNTTNRILTTNSVSLGFYLNNRTSSTVFKVFKDNAQIGTTNTTASSGFTSLTSSIFIGAINKAGTPDYYTNRQYAFASIGDGLTDTEAANFYTAVQAYQTTLGRQV